MKRKSLCLRGPRRAIKHEQEQIYMTERSKNGKAIYVKAGVWIRPDGSVSIAHPKNPRFHVRITNNSKLHARW